MTTHTTHMGWVDGLHHDLYHQDPRINYSLLKTVQQGPLFFLKHTQHPVQTPALDFGSALHEQLLIGQQTTKLPPAQQRLLDTLAQEVSQHPVWSRLINQPDARVEVSGFTHTFKIRCDVLIPSLGLILDLKTTQDDVSSFHYAAKKYGYHLQAAHYLDVAHHIDPHTPYTLFLLCVVQKKPPYLVQFFEFSQECLSSALTLRNALVHTLQDWQAHPDTLSRLAQDELETIKTLHWI